MAKAGGNPDYGAKVQALGWPDLHRLWTQIESRRTLGWARGRAFEHLILRGFELSGARVIYPYTVELQGQIVEQIDGMVLSCDLRCLIEAKDETFPTNVEPIVKLRNQLLRRPAGVVGSVFSRASFTEPARTLAQYMAPQAVLLWDGREVAALLARQNFTEALSRKYEYLVQMGFPDFDTSMESAS